MKTVDYKSICDKLGFKLEDYMDVVKSTTVDRSCFSELTEEELDFVMDYNNKHRITSL